MHCIEQMLSLVGAPETQGEDDIGNRTNSVIEA
jgi:hypothetical protein